MPTILHKVQQCKSTWSPNEIKSSQPKKSNEGQHLAYTQLMSWGLTQVNQNCLTVCLCMLPHAQKLLQLSTGVRAWPWHSWAECMSSTDLESWHGQDANCVHKPQDHTNWVDCVASKSWLCRSKGKKLRQVSDEHLHEFWILNMLIWYTISMAKWITLSQQAEWLQACQWGHPSRHRDDCGTCVK